VEEFDAEDVPKPVPEAIAYWLGFYSRSPAEAARNLRELAAKAPAATAEILLPMYAAGTCGEAMQLVGGLLGSNVRAVEKLCDPAAALEDSVVLAQTLAKHEPRFDVHFAKNLLVDEQATEEVLQRGLSILEQLGSCGRLTPILIQFLRSPNPRVRSRAALMMGRIVPTRNLIHRLMRDEDSRVRANFIEGLWSSAKDHCDLFRRALRDSHQRVAGNALIGLHRAGQSRDVILHVAQMARRTEAPYRATAAWVMGQTGEERYATVLRYLMNDPEPSVRRNALISLRRIKAAQTPQSA
jgi:HEAT repeat protein